MIGENEKAELVEQLRGHLPPAFFQYLRVIRAEMVEDLVNAKAEDVIRFQERIRFVDESIFELDKKME